jgi:hypothetical protein
MRISNSVNIIWKFRKSHYFTLQTPRSNNTYTCAPVNASVVLKPSPYSIQIAHYKGSCHRTQLALDPQAKMQMFNRVRTSSVPLISNILVEFSYHKQLE